MEPTISKISEDEGVLEFTMSDVHMSIANAVRRTILSDIPTVVFKTFPYKENQAIINKNTTRLNNEILKQRLSCIPIHIQDLETPLQDLEVVIKKKNVSNIVEFITTKDFRIRNVTLDNFIQQDEVKKIFPPDFISGTYIDFARLQPKVSDDIPGEEIDIVAKMSIGTASQDGAYNVVSACSYANTPDPVEMDTQWKNALTELAKEQELSKQEQELAKQNWYLLEGKRHFVKNSFDFMIETVGVYENRRIVEKAINIIVDHLKNVSEMIEQGKFIVEQSDTTLRNGYDIKLEGYDYTIGKIIEFMLYDAHYIRDKTLTYVAFKKIHPHDSYGLLRLAAEESSDSSSIGRMIQKSCESAIRIYEKMLPSFQ